MAHSLATVHAVVPARTLAFQPCDRTGAIVAGGVVRRTGPVPVTPEETRREYLDRHQDGDPLNPRDHVDGRRSLQSTGQLGGWRTFQRMEIGEFFDAHRLRHVVRMYLRDDQGPIAHVMLGRTDEEGEFTERELWLLRRMIAWLEHAYACALSARPERDSLVDPRLTQREQQVAWLASRGLRSKEIALALTLSEATVKSHLARSFRKLGVSSRVELAAQLGQRAS